MATPHFDEAPEIKRIADELIPLYHPHLLQNRVLIEYYFSDRKVGDHAVCRFGKVHPIKNLTAFLAQRDVSGQFAPMDFVCTSCLKWRPEGLKNLKEINGKDYYFDDACLDALNLEKAENPDEHFLSWLAVKADQVQQRTEAGAPDNTAASMFVIEIFEPMWKDATDAAKRAMVDSKLADCGSHENQSGDVILTKIPADIVEHIEIIERHGLGWRAELRKLERILDNGGQQELELVGGDPRESGTVSDEVIAAAAGHREAA